MYERFAEFGLSNAVLGALTAMGFEQPTPIQKITIGPLLKGRDVIGIAQTGTGKTAAFGIPIVEKGTAGTNGNPCAIVLVPTRELAVQVSLELNRIGGAKGILSLAVYGGQPIQRQMEGLRRSPHVIVGTPGRVQDHMERGTLRLRDIRMVVLDEADRMLDMGFIRDIERILRETPRKRQTVLFSATMPDAIVRISDRYMDRPEKIHANADRPVISRTKQVFYEVNEEDKMKVLTRLLELESPSLTLLFCHTKRAVDRVSGKLRRMGFNAGAIHGGHAQSSRDRTMRSFRGGEINILVATDVAARGLDIADVSHVINYSVPRDPDGYIHRIGRTGRAGKSGVAISLVTPMEHDRLRLIERNARTSIGRAQLPSRQEGVRDIAETPGRNRYPGSAEATGVLSGDARQGRDRGPQSPTALSKQGGRDRPLRWSSEKRRRASSFRRRTESRTRSQIVPARTPSPYSSPATAAFV